MSIGMVGMIGMIIGTMAIVGMTVIAGMTETGMNARRDGGAGVRKRDGGITMTMTVGVACTSGCKRMSCACPS